ncbi:MAG: hypothetical protein FJW88_04370 [Actinobacteria bacterium]|nr:hypothetical protein [Actinomycetota bacterium]
MTASGRCLVVGLHVDPVGLGVLEQHPYVVERDLEDGSVAGVDWWIMLEPGDEGWLVLRAEQRFSCLRGVSNTLCV